MVSFKDDEVIITKDTWDILSSDDYIDEVLKNIIDSEILAEAITTDNDFLEVREYARTRKSK
jgi:hypothetical protein